MSHLWRGAADLVVEPDVAGFAYDDFKRAGDLIRSGEVAMRQALPEVRKWLEAPAKQPFLWGHGESTSCRATSRTHARRLKFLVELLHVGDSRPRLP